ncbi:MAG: cysteine peptidase family C39 domain-containing protein, partial [Methanobacterium sp.]
AVLAGTDENGTTMYGLIQAAKSKGLNAKGMKLSINDLKKNSIVFLTINENSHYSVIREITNESVFIADPSLGNIAMTLEEFNNAYSGYALVISDPNISGANETTNTEINSTDNTLTDGELLNIRGLYRYEWVDGYWSWKPGYFSWVPGKWVWRPGYWYWKQGYWSWVPGHWAKWWIFWYWVPGHWKWNPGHWAYYPGHWKWNHGYWKWNPGHWVWNPGYWKKVYDFNLEKAVGVAGSTISIVSGVKIITGAVVAAPKTGGISLVAIGWGCTNIGLGVAGFHYVADDPWFI